MSVVDPVVPLSTSAPRRPRSRTAALVRPTDAYVIYGGILLLMLVSSLDVSNFFDRPNGASRYAILLIPFVAAAWVRARKPSWAMQEPTLGHVLLGAMVALGVGGSLYGLEFRNMSFVPLSIFVSMSVGLLLLLAVDGPTDSEVRRTLRRLGSIGMVYVVMNFLVNTGILLGITSHAGPLSRLSPYIADTLKYRNASAAFVALAFGYAIVERRWRRLVLLLVLFVGIFLGYPSATQVLIAFVTALTLLLTGRRASSLRTLITATLFVLLAVGALLNLNAVINATSSYFEAVHKTNANSGRLDLAAAGIDEFKQSPFVGQLFSADAVAVRLRDNKTLPFHDDAVLFLAEGGLLGIGLLVGWMLYTEVTLLRRYREFLRANDMARARMIRVCLVMLNAFFIAMPFNPVLEGNTRTAALFGVWAIAMSLGRPRPEPIDIGPLTPGIEAPSDTGLPAGTAGTSV